MTNLIDGENFGVISAVNLSGSAFGDFEVGICGFVEMVGVLIN